MTEHLRSRTPSCTSAAWTPRWPSSRCSTGFSQVYVDLTYAYSILRECICGVYTCYTYSRLCLYVCVGGRWLSVCAHICGACVEVHLGVRMYACGHMLFYTRKMYTGVNADVLVWALCVSCVHACMSAAYGMSTRALVQCDLEANGSISTQKKNSCEKKK